MHTAVVLMVFNRPDLTKRVFAEIARARPPKLLIVADGPRADRPDDREKCAATRAIVQRIDWDCEVLRNYSEVNLGCGWRPASGLMWSFEQVEEAIILEDDTIPHPSFFPFCEEMLEKYRDDERVMHISGDNWLFGHKELPSSYLFSRYCLSWGWATWRRSFRLYDWDIKAWSAIRGTPWLDDLLGDPRAVEYWTQTFDRIHSGIGKRDIWDYQWLFSIWLHHGLSILPDRNLVSNLGFNREDAVHTKGGANDPLNALPAVDMTFPLRHPDYMVRDVDADRLMFDKVISPRHELDLYAKLRHKCVGALPVPIRRSLSALKSRLASKAKGGEGSSSAA